MGAFGGFIKRLRTFTTPGWSNKVPGKRRKQSSGKWGAAAMAVFLLVSTSSCTTTGSGSAQSSAAQSAQSEGGAGLLASGGALRQTERVGPNGAYRTRIPIPVPAAPGAPTVSLEYDSSSAGGVAGVGWDLSVGWPTTIARDTRFGTPAWKYTGSWVWGGAPLVPSSPPCSSNASCEYRTAPDSLAKITIDLRSNAGATVKLSTGTVLVYEAVHYDGGSYPPAPPQADTDVFAFLLKKVTDRNGYETCFSHKHFGDKKGGRVAVVEEITFGGDLSSSVKCTAHKITFTYDDASAAGYYSPWSLRLGAPVTFSNRLTSAKVEAAGVPQWEIAFKYAAPTTTDTRRPLLKEVEQIAYKDGTAAAKRVVAQFTYGRRDSGYGSPRLLDLGAPSGQFPPSLSGGVSRPIRGNSNFQALNLRYQLFQAGGDQIDEAAPPSNATTELWSLLDFNGDGWVDSLWAREKGFPAVWESFEDKATTQRRPAQQIVDISEGVASLKIGSTRAAIDARALELGDPDDLMRGRYPPPLVPSSVGTWIWGEGRGMTRTGMPVSVGTPEISDGIAWPAGAPCPFVSKDTRRWPKLPDGTQGGSQGSTGQLLGDVLNTGPLSGFLASLISIHKPYVPHDSVSATVSGWLDIDGDGAPEFVTTPAMIHQFDWFCPTDPHPAADPQRVVDTQWHVGSAQPAANGLGITARPKPGPKGPCWFAARLHCLDWGRRGIWVYRADRHRRRHSPQRGQERRDGTCLCHGDPGADRGLAHAPNDDRPFRVVFEPLGYGDSPGPSDQPFGQNGLLHRIRIFAKRRLVRDLGRDVRIRAFPRAHPRSCADDGRRR